MSKICNTYVALRRYPGIGVFLSAQWAIDLIYSGFLKAWPDENFCLSGNGAMAGMSLCFRPRTWSYSEVNAAICALARHTDFCFELVTGRKAPRLEGRLPLTMDQQNMNCELQKWLLYSAQHLYTGGGGRQNSPLLPSWWIRSSGNPAECLLGG
jgi:hypothetical protein